MTVAPSFLRFAAVCCFITVITTLGIHLFFPAPPTDFEERAMLHRDGTYLLNRWWVIVHCVLVLVSMWGFALVQFKKAPGMVGLGFLFFTVFAIAEITRQMYVLFYINDLRAQYVAVTDGTSKENLRNLLMNAGQHTVPFYGVFLLAFGLGNLFYGLSLWREKSIGKWLGILLVAWAAGTFVSLGNSFWKSKAVDEIVHVYSYTFQPLMRAAIGVWLWQLASPSRPVPVKGKFRSIRAWSLSSSAKKYNADKNPAANKITERRSLGKNKRDF